MNSNDKKPLVVCQCATYNHEPYIRECLEGFVMQKTDFPFIAVVIDDCSTDATADIVREYEQKYPDIIKAVYLKENYYSQGKKKDSIWHSFNKDAKYIAICEGDDYWTDPLKLQKQVDFLEEHEECPFCFHKAEIKSDVEKENKLYSYVEEGYYSDRDIYSRWIVPTASVVFRRTDLTYYPPCNPLVYGDIYLFLCLLYGGKKAYCFGFYGSVYRKHDGGILRIIENDTSHMYYEKIIKQYQQFYKLFPLLSDITIRTIKEYLVELINAPYFPNQWKHCLHYLFLRKRLVFSRFPLKICRLFLKSLLS